MAPGTEGALAAGLSVHERRVPQVSSAVLHAILRNDFEETGRLIRKTWKQNQLLDEGTNPAAVQALTERIDDLCLGYKLPGAGGGGYLYMVAKDLDAAVRIRRILTEERPNERARFVEMSLSNQGRKEFPGSFYFDYFPLFSVGSGTQYSGCAEQTFSRYTGDYPHALGLDSGGGIRRVFYHGAAGGTDYPPLRLPHRGADGPGAVWHRGVAVHPNPYDTVLGEPEGSERRINLAQSFNGLGWICGPLTGGFFLFAGGGDVTTPYAVLGTVVLCIAILFSRVKLPEIGREAESGQAEVSGKSLWKTTSFTVGLLSLSLYVAAQTGINSFFINYATENAGVSAQEASVWLSFGGMGLFMAGRMGGSWLMRFVKGEKVLAVCAAGACVCMAAVILMQDGISCYCAFYVNQLCFLLFFPYLCATLAHKPNRLLLI